MNSLHRARSRMLTVAAAAVTVAAVTLGAAATAAAQATTYHLHNEASTTPSTGQLKTAGPEVAAVAIQSIDLKNVAPTAVVIKSFDTQAGVPGTAGTIASGATVSFTLWMKKSANRATMFPQGVLRLNDSSGTPLCTATGTSAVTTTLTKFVISCTTAAVVTLTATDRFWLSAGVNMTAGPGNQSVTAQVSIEGTLNGNYDSLVSVPAIQPPPPPLPVLTDLSPAFGFAGNAVTVTGSGFGATKGTSTITFNGTTATTTAWSATSITATVPGAATSGPVRVTTTAGASNTLTFAVLTTGSIAGTVTRVTGGQAIAGATVEVLQAGALKATATTAANGTYATGSLTSGGYDVRVSAAGFVTQIHAGIAVVSGASTVNAALAVPATISGTIMQTDGVTPVVGAAVTVSSSAAERSAVSTAGGSFTVSSLPPATYAVTASAPGYATQTQAGVVLADGGSASANLLLPAAAPSVVRYVYDAAGRLAAAVDPAGEMARYHYDAAGNVTAIGRESAGGLSILSFAPVRGPVGTAVTLTGTGFSPTPAQNAVSFSGIAATVTSATPTTLVVTVPATAASGTVGVVVGAASAVSATAFTVTSGTGAPTVSGFAPSIGAPGTTVTVTGTNFSTALADNVPFFNASRAGITSAAVTQLVAPVPAAATSGRISVANAFGTGTSVADFFVPQSPYTAADVDLTGRLVFGQPFAVPYPTLNKIAMLVFDAAAGERISVQFTNITDGARAFSLRGPDAKFLIPYQSGGTFLDSLIMPLAGTYTLTWMGGSNTGGRTVTAHNPVDVVTPAVPGGPAQAVSTSTPGQNFRFPFTGTAGARVAVQLANVTIAESDVSILKPDGTPLGAATFVSPPTGFADAQLLPVAGLYTVLLNPRAANTGAADVTLLDATDATGTIAADGQPVLAATTVPGQNARLTFSGAAGQRVSLRITTSTFGTGFGFTCAAAYSIVTAADVALASNNCVLPNADAFIDVITLPAAGTYTVLVNPDYIYTGSATLRLYDVPADLTGALTSGSPVSVQLDYPGQNASYTFAGTAGNRISLHVPSGSISCASIGIVPPGETTPVTSTLACPTAFLEPYTMPTSGTYTIVVNPQEAKTGTLTLTLYNVPADYSAPGSIGGGAVAVSTSAPGQNAFVTFTGGGQIVTISISGSSFGCTTVKLMRPDGTQQASTFICGATGTIANQTLVAVGQYKVVFDPSGASTGGASVTIVVP